MKKSRVKSSQIKRYYRRVDRHSVRYSLTRLISK